MICAMLIFFVEKITLTKHKQNSNLSKTTPCYNNGVKSENCIFEVDYETEIQGQNSYENHRARI